MERPRLLSIRASGAPTPSSPRIARLAVEDAKRPAIPLAVDRIDLVFRTLWRLIVLPFRVIGWTFDLLGRLIGFAFGFTLMVCGSALWAGPLYMLGVPMFFIGLLLTLKSVG